MAWGRGYGAGDGEVGRKYISWRDVSGDFPLLTGVYGMLLFFLCKQKAIESVYIACEENV